jgi:hypothetical protein
VRRNFVNVAAYAWRTLVLSFFAMALIRFLMDDGGWFNVFIVFLILCSGFAMALVSRRLRRE